jgi:GNAT superfamily N-acetyltransferase
MIHLFQDFNHSRRNRGKKPGLSKLIIREAGMDDAEMLTELRLSREKGDFKQTLEKFEAEIKNLERNERLLIVAEVAGKVIAFARANYFRLPDNASYNMCPEGWYLTGVLVDSSYRSLGIGSALTSYRLAWIAERADKAYYFSNARNRVSIRLHSKFGFKEVSRDFVYPDVEFRGGKGILFEARLTV